MPVVGEILVEGDEIGELGEKLWILGLEIGLV